MISYKTLLISCAALLLVASGASADEWICSDITAVTVGPDSEDHEVACLGAHDAMAFLEAHGLRLGGIVRVNIVPRLAETACSMYGYFSPRDGEAYVLGYSALLAQFESAFGLPINRDLHRSLVAHEVAHVIAERNFLSEDPPLAAVEYIAYVTQLATMPPEHRAQILATFPGEGFEADEISSLVLHLDPEYFAVAAYRHFIGSNDGTAVFRRMLTGEFREPSLH